MHGKPLDIENWRNKLGLFPMPLFQNKSEKEKFVLLNGGAMGNLCLDFKNDGIENIRNHAWSSDIGHYLTIDDDYLSVYRWDTYKTNKYKTIDVANRLDSFYDHLKQQSINKQDSVVKFGIQLYRQIRSLLRDNRGQDSLNTLLYLLACVADDADRNKLVIRNWAISSTTKSFVVDKIKQTNWDNLHEILVRGLQSKGLTPDINLILRHASGNLFQEAHFETLFPVNYQQTLPGFLPKVDDDLNKKSKNQTSAHFTPTSIVRTIVEESIRAYSFRGVEEITVLDPACGSGEFLKEFIRQISLQKPNIKIKVIGWDISEAAVNMANFIVNYEAKPFKENITIKIEQKDALKDGKNWKVKADFILMNPPFISWELMEAEQRENTLTLLGNLGNKRPNTAGAFLWNAVNSLNTKGIIGCVLPTSIFENETYIPLREEIKKGIDIKILGRLGSHTLFSDALVDTAIFLGTNISGSRISNKNNPLVFWSDYKTESASTSLRELRKVKSQSINEIIDEDGYSLYSNPLITEGENWMPIPYKSFDLLSKFKTFSKVEDVFDVRQGVRTGLNSAFLVSKNYYQKLSLKEKKYFRPAVTNESIIECQLNDGYYIFYAEGEYEINSKEGLIKAVPNFYRDVLEPNFLKLSSRARKGEHNFWRLSEHRAWQIQYTPKIVSKEFGKAGSFSFDKTGIFVAERSHAWFPKKDLQLGELGYAYVCILRMPIINDFLSGLSKQIGGGQWYLSSKFINSMPLPNLFDTKKYPQSIIDELVQLGVQLCNGEQVEEEQLIQLSNIVFNG